MCTGNRATTLRATKITLTAVIFWALVLVSGPVRGQNPPATPPAKATTPQGKRPGTIVIDVNLVVLHATVVDGLGKFVPDLKEENFKVFEDRVEQKLTVFKREDIPVTVGLVIDNSGSMNTKRDRVNAAALTFVKSSNRDDETFVVNFNDDYYLDLDKDFTNDVNELKDALERIDSRGGTALYDAIVGSLDHLKKGTRDKKVLLVISDGVDTMSRKKYEDVLLEAQQSEASIYAVGLFSEDDKKKRRSTIKELRGLAEATGGLAYFPEGLLDVENICTQIAHDIRNQYTLAYYSTNSRRDGTFRAVRVDVNPPKGRGKLFVRTRSGYYAQTASTGAGSGN